MPVQLDLLDECATELEMMRAGASKAVLLRLSKLNSIWKDRRRNGFAIDGPGQPLTLEGPSGEPVRLRIYRYPNDIVGGIVAVSDDGSRARILKVGEFRTGHQLDTLYDEGEKRLTTWIRKHGSL